MSMKLGKVTLAGRRPGWEVYREDDGSVVVERDAPNGSIDDVYPSLDALKAELRPGYRFEPAPIPAIEFPTPLGSVRL